MRARYTVLTGAPAILAIALLSGCNAESDDAGGDGGTASLSAESRASAAAQASASQFLELSGTAEAQASGAVDSNSGSSNSLEGVSARNGSVSCAGRVDSDTEQGFKGDGSANLAVDDRTWNSEFSNKSGFPDSGYVSDDYQARLNCTLEDSNGNTIGEYLGSFDIVQKSDMGNGSGRTLLYAQAGALGDATLDYSTPPDMSGNLAMKFSAGTTETDIDMRYSLQQCTGCKSGDLSDWTGDPDRDQTVSSFLAMDMTISGTRTQIQAGEADDPFVFTSVADSGDRANVEMNGRMQFGGSGECSYDVTLNTPNSVLFEDMSEDPTPLSGTIEVTDNNSQQTFTVTFSNGNQTVTQNGTTVSTDTEAIADCGFS